MYIKHCEKHFSLPYKKKNLDSGGNIIKSTVDKKSGDRMSGQESAFGEVCWEFQEKDCHVVT